MAYLESRYAFVQQGNLGPFYRFKAARALAEAARLDDRPIQSFLDIGCACGDLAGGMKANGLTETAGIEPDAGMIERAQKSGAGTFVQGSILDRKESLRGRFDLVGAFEVMEHIEPRDHRAAFEAFRFYAKPGGRGVIMVPNAAHPLLGGWIAWSDYTHRCCFTAESLAQFLRANGVERAMVRPWYSASGPVLLGLRETIGAVAGTVAKIAASAVSTVPGRTDPFISDAFPMSAHLVAVFEVPR
jgi:SAM-dependent methyltransferase